MHNSTFIVTAVPKYNSYNTSFSFEYWTVGEKDSGMNIAMNKMFVESSDGVVFVVIIGLVLVCICICCMFICKKFLCGKKFGEDGKVDV